MTQATTTTERPLPAPALARRRQTSPEAHRARTLEDRRLFLRYKRTQSPATRAELVERFLPLARRLALRFQRSSEPMDDLLQVASIGLLKAIERFDPDRGIAFSSFAVPTILGELRRHLRDKTWSVHVPRDLQEMALKVRGGVERLEGQLGRSPTPAEIADHLGVSVEDVLDGHQAMHALQHSSLDGPRPASDVDDGDTLGDTIGSFDDGFGRAEARATLDSLVGVLDDRDREVLRLRFEEDMTQTEIAQRVGCSQMHVSRILRAALARLQTAAEQLN